LQGKLHIAEKISATLLRLSLSGQSCSALNQNLNKKTAKIMLSAEKGHQMMPFLLLVRQI
jgi:hypothetical protein